MREAIAALAGARLRLELGARGAVLRRAAHGWQQRFATVAELAWDADPSLDAAAFVERCAPLFAGGRCAGLPLSVRFGATQARLFMVTPPSNLARLGDLRAAAAQRLHALYGDGVDGWQLAFDGAVDTPFLACATPHARLAALRALAAAQRLHLVNAGPRFVAAWNAVRARLGDDWLAVVDDGMLAFALPSADAPRRLHGVHLLRLPAERPDPLWLREQAGRIALREGLAAPERLRLVHGDDAPGSLVELPRLHLVARPGGLPVQREAAG